MSDEFVVVGKLDLPEGVEMWDFAGMIMEELTRQKAKLDRSLSLHGIFNDHIIVRDRETAKLYKLAISLDGDGTLVFGDQVEVRMEYVPVKTNKSEKSEVQKHVLSEEIRKRKVSFWHGIL